jgi:hypothetical protein
MQVTICDCARKLVKLKILCKSSRTKALAANVNGIGTCLNRSEQALKAACGSQKLGKSRASFHIVTTFL